MPSRRVLSLPSTRAQSQDSKQTLRQHVWPAAQLIAFESAQAPMPLQFDAGVNEATPQPPPGGQGMISRPSWRAGGAESASSTMRS